MTVQCRAKNPNSCRVHGSGGEIQRLQVVANLAAADRNMDLYMSTRAQIEAMTDDEDAASFIAPDTGSLREGGHREAIIPDTGNLIVDNFKDSKRELLEESPNDMLLSNLSQSSVQQMPDTEAIKSVLKSRGYEDKDLFMTKHFGFKKTDSGWANMRDITEMECIRASMEIEKNQGVQVSSEDRSNFIGSHFRFISRDKEATKEQVAQFVEGYESYVQNYQA